MPGLHEPGLGEPNTHSTLTDPAIRRSMLSVITWDGLLPVIVATFPVIVRIACRKNDAVQVIAVIVVPMAAALLRSSIAWGQLARACQGRAPWHRQVAVAVAIICLLFVEIAVAACTLVANIPADGWLWPIVLYIVYLTLMYWALRPLARA